MDVATQGHDEAGTDQQTGQTVEHQGDTERCRPGTHL